MKKTPRGGITGISGVAGPPDRDTSTIYLGTTSDTLILTDDAERNAIYARVSSETIDFVEDVGRSSVMPRTATADTIVFSDGSDRVPSYGRSVSETINLTDATVRSAMTFNRESPESLTFSDDNTQTSIHTGDYTITATTLPNTQYTINLDHSISLYNFQAGDPIRLPDNGNAQYIVWHVLVVIDSTHMSINNPSQASQPATPGHWLGGTG